MRRSDPLPLRVGDRVALRGRLASANRNYGTVTRVVASQLTNGAEAPWVLFDGATMDNPIPERDLRRIDG